MIFFIKSRVRLISQNFNGCHVVTCTFVIRIYLFRVSYTAIRLEVSSFIPIPLPVSRVEFPSYVEQEVYLLKLTDARGISLL